MKTPMQELIKQMSYNRDRALGAEKDAYNICILYAENMLEKEKDVIMDAYMEGGDWESLPQPRFDNYYNETFNTKEKIKTTAQDTDEFPYINDWDETL